MSNERSSLLEVDTSSNDRIVINSRCRLVRTEDIVVVFADGRPLLSYSQQDQASARLAMVQLVESGVATQQEVAVGFGVQRVTVYRQRMKFGTQGVEGLVPRRRGPKGPHKVNRRKERVIVKLKDAGMSNVGIAQRLGLSKSAIRVTLKRLGYQMKVPVQDELRAEATAPKVAEAVAVQEQLPPEDSVPDAASEEATEQASTELKDDGSSIPKPRSCAAELVADRAAVENSSEAAPEQGFPIAESVDTDPANRTFDRLLARLGFLDDAAPLFQTVEGVAGAGVLLALPVLVGHGVFVDVKKVFFGLGAAFYGLRNSVLALLVCFLRGINRPENLKEHSPTALGQIMGLDRAPEMKTLRRKIRQLVAQNRALQLMRAQAQRLLRRCDKELLWLYVDGHVSVYSGKRKLPKHRVTRLRISLPSVLDYWVNDEKGDPVLVYEGGPSGKRMAAVLKDVVGQVRALGEKRTITLVFDREGWSPALFAALDGMQGVRFLTYRKAQSEKKLPLVARQKFKRHTGSFDGEEIEYDLADKRIHIDYGRRERKKRLVLRQVTRRCDDGHQTHIVTNDWETATLEVAHRMFARWGQENYFKYMGEHKDFDGLLTYLMEDGDSNRLVPDPRRAVVANELKRARGELEALKSKYGERALNNQEDSRPTMRGFKIANGKLGQEIKQQQEQVHQLKVRLRQMPAKVPLASISGSQSPKKVHSETRRLIHTFRMAAYRGETALRELLRAGYPRWRQDGRTLIRTFLNATGDLEVSDTELRVMLHQQSAPHRTRALAHLCEELNALGARFPGSSLTLRFGVRKDEDVASSR